MRKKLRETLGVIIVLILHFLIMSIILVCIGVSMKYQLEHNLIGTQYFSLVTLVYDMIYFLYYGSLISFVVLFLSYIFIIKWITNHKEKHKNVIK